MDIREITEAKIFETLGRGVPMCTTLNEADANAIRSMLLTEQAIRMMPPSNTGQIRGLEVILDRQRINLEEIRTIRKDMGCK